MNLPAANLRSLVIRYAAQVFELFYRPAEAEAAGPRRSGAAASLQQPEAAGGGAAGNAAALQSVSEMASMQSHYFVKPAVQLAELISRLNICEGRANKTRAGVEG